MWVTTPADIGIIITIGIIATTAIGDRMGTGRGQCTMAATAPGTSAMVIMTVGAAIMGAAETDVAVTDAVVTDAVVMVTMATAATS